MPMSEIDSFDYLNVTQYLGDLYKQRKQTKKPYSYELFCDELGFGKTSYMHQIIFQKRTLTDKAARRIAAAIPLRKQHRAYFLAMVEWRNAKNIKQQEEVFGEMIRIRSEAVTDPEQKAQLQYFGKWYYPVVREVVRLRDSHLDPARLAKIVQPNLTKEEAEDALTVLQQAGFIKYDGRSKKWKQNQPVITVTSFTRNLALVGFHQKMIDLGKQSLLHHPASKRDISSLTFAIRHDQFESLKQRIEAFRAEVLKDYSLAEKTDLVVQMNLQLFQVASTVEGGDDEE